MFVPSPLRDLKQWLVWRNETVPGKSKNLKVPYYANGTRRTGTQGDAPDRAKLTTVERALEAMARGNYTGVGFAFLPGDGLIGIDLDHVVDKETGEIAEHAARIVDACASFTEYSVSGTGLHVYVTGETQTAKSDDIGVEIYQKSQYFAFTGRMFPGMPDIVGPISEEALALVHGMIDEAKEARRRKQRQAAPAPAASSSSSRAPAAGGDNDFKRVNDAAMANLDAWVPALFPYARRHRNGYRVSSRDLGRELEEDLAIQSDGIVDFGVRDMGDPRAGGRTPIDLVMEWGKQPTPLDALVWLGPRVGVEVKKRGSRNSAGKAGQGGGGAQPPAGGAPGGDAGSPGNGLPLIRVKAGELPESVDEAESALLEAGEQLYQRDRLLVRVTRRSVPSVRNYKRPAGTLGIVPVEQPFLVETLTRVARWEKWDARIKNPDKPEELGGWKRINAPEQVAATYLARAGHWNLPEMWSVITAPTLRPDGTILQKPGYDAATRCWYDPCGIKFPTIPERPTADDAKRALAKLRSVIQTLPFEDEVDFSVAMALMLCALVRRSLPSAPLGAISATAPSSGKSLLADCIAILATGSAAAAMSYAETDEEAKKTMLAVLMEGDPVVLIDNVERPLQGDWLCSILTQETFSQRMLGRTEMAKVLTTTLILATGNALLVSGDLRTRTLLCRIDPKVERPEERSFPVELRDLFLDQRTELVAAGLTLMRAYIISGAKDTVKPWGRFERWSDMVRAPLVWLDCIDPCASIRMIEQDDPERTTHVQVMRAWFAIFESKPQTCRQVLDKAAGAARLPDVASDEEKKLAEVLRDVAVHRDGTWNTKKFGHWLRRLEGRIASGLKIMKEDGQNGDHTGLWKVKEVKEAR
jgi:hypothetical protein